MRTSRAILNKANINAKWLLFPRVSNGHNNAHKKEAIGSALRQKIALVPTWHHQSRQMVDLASTLSFPLETIAEESQNTFFIKTVATIGPASANPKVLTKLLQNGVNVCRLNFSHGTHEYYAELIQMIRETAEKVGVADTLAIALDTKGPEVRTAPNKNGDGIRYETGQRVIVKAIVFGNECNTLDTVYVSYKKAITQAAQGGCILLADGQCTLRITKVLAAEEALECMAEVADLTLSGRNNVHFPGINVDIESLSSKDKADIAFGIKMGIDMIFASFTRSGEHMSEIRKEVRLHDTVGLDGGPDIDVPIIAKIESEEGIKNIEDIINASDGIMIARGDLGVELPVEALFLAQKTLAARAFIKAKPVICATQMLESMTTHNRPTRAEASDVANAVIDGADCLMLSGETAAGNHPIDATKVMRRIAARADDYCASLSNFKGILAVSNEARSTHIGSIASAAVLSSFELEAKFIVTTTVSGNSVRQLAKYRPRCPIIAVCRERRTARALAITRGVIPIVCSDVNKDVWELSFPHLVERGIAKGLEVTASGKAANESTAGDAVSDNLLKPTIVIITNTDMKPYNRCSMTIRML